MRYIEPTCLTRVVVDGVHDVEVAHLHVIEERIRQCLPQVPEAQRQYIGHALFNLAIQRMLSPSSQDSPEKGA